MELVHRPADEPVDSAPGSAISPYRWTTSPGRSNPSRAGLRPGPIEEPGGADGPRTAFLTDPDGYRIELVQWPRGHPDGLTQPTGPDRDVGDRAVGTSVPVVSAWCPMPTELTTPRLHMDAWRDDDLDDYQTLVHERDPRTAAAPRGGRPTRDDLRETILRLQASHADTGIGLLVIRIADHFAGYCGLTVGRATLAEPELAYELLQMNQGSGYATEAARAVVHAAAHTGRGRLWATVRSWNDASFRVLEKVGFERTDRIRRTTSATPSGARESSDTCTIALRRDALGGRGRPWSHPKSGARLTLPGRQPPRSAFKSAMRSSFTTRTASPYA